MKLRTFPTNYLILACFVMSCLFFTACTEQPTNNPVDNFDKQAMLHNTAHHLILPNYQQLQQTLHTLTVAVNAFADEPNQEHLQTAQNAFELAYGAWQHCAVFEFGPAYDVQLRTHVNTFPVDINQVATNIISLESVNFDAANNIDAKGLPAIDYLLFGLADNNADIVFLYQADSKASDRQQYLRAVLNDLEQRVDGVLMAWDAYTPVFTSSLGNDIGSSLGLLVNELNFDYELLKNFKIGIPAGVKLGIPGILPAKTEAYYNKTITTQLAIENLQSLHNLYKGIGTNGDGIGLYEYLIELQAPHSSGLLADAIDTGFKNAINALESLPSTNFVENLEQHRDAVVNVYSELQKTVILLKTDMPSHLGVSITYIEEGDTD